MSWNRRGKFNFVDNKDNIMIGLLILGIVINLFSEGKSKNVYVLTSGKTTETPELNQFCTSFVDQIVNKSLQAEMVEADIYDVLIQDNYKELKLVGQEKTIFSRASDDNCAVVIKDKLGLRRFNIWVNKSFDYPFYYRVQKVNEPLVEG